MHHGSGGAGLDEDSKFTKQDRVRSQKSRVRAPLVSRSVASHEVKAKLKIACLDSNSNFAVFTKSKFTGIKNKTSR